jgi:hypothetical protein
MIKLKTVFVLFAGVTVAGAQTTISGTIGDMVLDSSGNPFIVEKDITVPQGKTLTVKEGCALLFKPFTGLTIAGNCSVNGTQEHPAVFTSINDSAFNKTSTQPAGAFDWNGITVAKKSGSVVFNYLDVRFSVYGIKSQNPAIVLKQSTFKQNGQFHFTINDKIQDVVENNPFSYNGKNSQPQAGTAAASTQQTPLFHRKGVRFGLLGVGGVGAIVGTILSINAAQKYSHWKDIANSNDMALVSREWDKSKNEYNSAFTGALITDIIAGIGLAGFGLTFAF